MTDETTTEVVAQPALPTLELPDFEGTRPVGVVTRLNGAGSRIVRPMHLEETVVLVIEAKVKNVGHDVTDDGVKRVHVLTVKDLYELEGKAGATLLRSLRQAWRIADDKRHGREPLGMAELEQPESNAAGIAVEVDDDGRVHTATNGAGEALGLPHVDVAVLVLDDGSRHLWPDDFAGKTGPHPEAGERISKPGSKKGDETLFTVRSVLDADTGEELEVWTDEQEDERLREEEADLRRKEDEEDLAAVAELEAGRAWRKVADELMSGGRSIASVKKDLVEVDDVRVVKRALEIENEGPARAGMVAALEARLAELTETKE